MYIISYKCSKDCSMQVRLTKQLPVFWFWIPEKYRRVPIRRILLLPRKLHVRTSYDEEGCIACKKVVRASMMSKLCMECGAKDSFVYEGKECSVCKKGVVVEDAERRIMF